MIGVAFWNTGISPRASGDLQKISRIEDAIVDIVLENDCHIIVLAEFNAQTTGLCNKLSLIDRDFRERKAIADTRVKILADNCLTSAIIRDSRYYVIHEFSFIDYHFLLGGVHFPSKLCAEEEDIQVVGRDFIDAVKEAEREVGHDKVAMIGDFNSNPFENIMVGFDYIHAIFDASTVEQTRSRELYGKRNPLFYNPMWNLLGDTNYPKGSYYSDSGKSYKLYWNVFDQVILSAGFMKAYTRKSLKIIAKTNNNCLLNQKDKPDKENYSDHLPVYFSLTEDLL